MQYIPSSDDPGLRLILFSETDHLGTIMFVNDAFCEVSKYSRQDLLGKPHSIIRHPDMPSKLFKILWTTIRSGNVFRCIIKNMGRDQRHFWVEAVIMPVADRKGNILRHISYQQLIEDEQRAALLYDDQVQLLLLDSP